MHAQNWQNYVQFNTGISIEGKGYMFQSEYGKTYKWLDVGISIDYESHEIPLGVTHFAHVTLEDNSVVTIQSHPENGFTGHSVLAVRLNARIDLIRLMLNNSRHALKIGGGYGYARQQSMSSKPNEYGQNYFISTGVKHSWEGALKATYEFEITPAITLGAFFFGANQPACGVGIRRNF
ncbi:hypothetical protein FACS1894182_10040 [Bacteroidia bacterium]|nr:hypothetical protein FACS1894182_10040 [Bacteroidia bacterium]